MIKSIKNTLERILLTSIVAISINSACGDETQNNPGDTGELDAGDTSNEQTEIGAGLYPCRPLGELYLNSPIAPDHNKRGAPLSEDINLEGEVTVYQGSRVVAIDEQSGLVYFYGPQNNAACITEVGGENAEILTRPDFTLDDSCQCYPAAIVCRDDGTWDSLHGEELPDILEDCGWMDLDCDGNPLNGYEPDVPFDCVREEIEGILFSDDGTPISKDAACRRGSQYCREINTSTGRLDNRTGEYGFGAVNESGQWELGYCADYVGPEQEFCDSEGADNDCDGVPDTEENLGPCGSNEGRCVPGYLTCAENGDEICVDEIPPENEICNGRDDDCDGDTDEDLYRPCLDVCGWGTQACRPVHLERDTYVPRENWGDCSTIAQPEICDGLDNDCNNVVDEGCSCAIGTSRRCILHAEMNVIDELGRNRNTECGYGQQECKEDEVTEAVWEEECHPPLPGLPLTPDTVWLQSEDCDAYDNNCDGHIDEAFNGVEYEPLSELCYDGEDGTAGVGNCRTGIRECVMGAWSLDCEGQVTPAENDICWDNQDNDCDGNTDNYNRRYGQIDAVFIIDKSGSMTGEQDYILDFLDEFQPRLASSGHLFAHVKYGDDNPSCLPPENQGCPSLSSDLTDYEPFRANVRSVRSDGSTEPDADAAHLSTDPENSFGITVETTEITPWAPMLRRGRKVKSSPEIRKSFSSVSFRI